jgi:hypothetical protein
MSEHWDALIQGDYDYVMPVTWKRKYGMRYVYQPAFIQQLGIFGKDVIDKAKIGEFIHVLQQQFHFAEYTMNYGNLLNMKTINLEGHWRNNFVLDLGKEHQNHERTYDTYLRQRIQRSKKNELIYAAADDLSLIKTYKKTYGNRLPFIRHKDYVQFEKLCSFYRQEGQLIVRKVFNNNHQMVAGVLMIRDTQRLYNILSVISPEGKKLLANYFLYDQIIREFSGSGLLLDFEGSDVPGIAYFYEKFADKNQAYPFICFNHLPAPFKWIKKSNLV